MTDGIALGVIEGAVYGSKKMRLNPGDTIFTFTDGVTEAMDKNDVLYSEEKLESLLKENFTLSATDLVKKCFENVHEYATDALQSDDITALALKLF